MELDLGKYKNQVRIKEILPLNIGIIYYKNEKLWLLV